MADPMKIRASSKGDIADVRVLMAHPMETGQRKDAAASLPLHFIQEHHGEAERQDGARGQISQAVSRNPVFSFRLKGGAKAGDKIEIGWLDNKGETQPHETAVA